MDKKNSEGVERNWQKGLWCQVRVKKMSWLIDEVQGTVKTKICEEWSVWLKVKEYFKKLM